MLSLERYCYSRVMGTFGTLRLEDGWECLTVERPWAGNAPSVSCIPEGVYEIELGTYHRGSYPAYGLTHVVGRSLIKIHIANLASDVQGCIGLGRDEGWIGTSKTKECWGVTSSRLTYDEFMRRLGGRRRDVLRIAQRRI